MFGPTSRYAALPTATFTTADGTEIVYVCRRFVPPSIAFSTLLEHYVGDGERLDRLANDQLGDPEQYWRICDANDAIDPNELTDNVGGMIRITLPEGITEPKNAQ